ncbi:MAG: UDP-3-O-acyl-N-acetylglucosamine deacetylase [Rhizomicrobium sp.]
MTRRTIAREVTAEGVALHAGRNIRMTLTPAPPGTGIVFRRSDLGGVEIPARYDRVSETRLGTVIGEGSARVGVIEHLMAAISGAEIDDLIVTLDGPEPPILDGDALSFLDIISAAGVRESNDVRRAVRMLRRVEVYGGKASAALAPADTLTFDFEITFPSAAIGMQRMDWAFSPDGFRSEIAPARTFGFMHELDGLNKAGLARGASLDNTLAIDGDRVINASLMRFPDEFVRHKILDALGDLALVGAPIIGRFEGRKSGHALNNALLRSLFSDSGNFEMVTS